MIKYFKYFSFLFLGLSLFAAWGCKTSYSFSGASISPDIKTVSIQNFPNYAPLAQPSLSQKFTESLRDIVTSRTNLNFIAKNGDVAFEGSITGFNTSPIAVSLAAAQVRLTINVHVKFTNLKDEKLSFEQDFSRFADFPATQTLASVENELIREINAQLSQEIFTRAFSNW